MNRTIIPLARLLDDNRSAESLVSFGRNHNPGFKKANNQGRNWGAFYADVRSLRARLGRSRSGDWLIVADDAYALAVGVFGALHAGCRAVLPANLQPGHLANLSSSVDGVIEQTEPTYGVAHAIPVFEADHNPADVALTALGDAAELILHTSGTMGEPLAVKKPLRCLDAEIAVLEATFGGRVSSRKAGGIYATVPGYHIYGLLFRVLWPLAAARPFAGDLISYPEQLAVSEAEMPVSILVSSPAFLKRVGPVLDFDYLNTCRSLVFSSGGLLPPDTAAYFNARLSQPIIEVYGSTETGGIGYRFVKNAKAPPAWTPLPDVALSIDPEKKVLAVRSPFIPVDDWLVTGDLAKVGADGTFELKGRADRIVKLEELRVSLSEMERRLIECTEVAAVNVFPLAAGKSERQVLAAVIQPSDAGWKWLAAHDKQAMKDRLIAALKPYFSAVALPRRWRFVRRIPESASGKTSRGMLEALFADNRGQKIKPRVLQKDVAAEETILRLRLDPDITYFDGHFDSEPILAGVAQVDWAIGFAMNNFSITGSFRRIEALKFFKVMFAGEEVSLGICYDAERTRVNFSYFDGETKFSSGRVVFENPS